MSPISRLSIRILIWLFISIFFVACGGGGSTSSASPTPTPLTKSIALSWSSPTGRTDGSNVSPTDIAGYKLHYGTSPGVYSKTINVGNITSYTLNSMSFNTYYIAVSAYDKNSVDSALSREQMIIVK